MSRSACEAHLGPDKRLEARLKVVDAAVVKFGHLVQQLLILGFEILPDWPQLFPCLKRDNTNTHTPLLKTGRFLGEFWSGL